MSFTVKNLISAIEAIETNVLQALQTHNPRGKWPSVCSQLDTPSALIDGQHLRMCCDIFKEVYTNHKAMKNQWAQDGASAHDKKYLFDYLVRFYEISLTCQMIRQAKLSLNYEFEDVCFIKEILESKSVTEQLSLNGCTEEDAAFCKMRMDFKNTLDESWKDRTKTRDTRWNKVRDAYENFEPEEARFSPKGHLTGDDEMATSSVITSPPSFASNASSFISNSWSSLQTSIHRNFASGTSKNLTKPESNNTAS